MQGLWFRPVLPVQSEANMALYYRSAISNLPDGYTFRGATLHDVPVVVHLFNQRQGTGNTAPLVEEIRREWQTPQFNPAIDVRLIFDQRERLIGYIEVWSTLATPLQPWLWGCVHPDYEGRGIGTTLLSWAEARVRLAMDMLPNQKRVTPRFGAPQALTAAQALCAALGWQPVEGATDDEQPKKTTGALRLLQDVAMRRYDIYEKEILAEAAPTAQALC
jgi:GNAT superfamily N-acetyltransferase